MKKATIYINKYQVIELINHNLTDLDFELFSKANLKLIKELYNNHEEEKITLKITENREYKFF